MKLSWFAAVCAVGVTLSVGTAKVSAQPPVPGGGYSRPPAFSPYLNLLRAGGSPALNYYGIVRPQQQFRESIQNLSNDVNLNEQAIGNLAATGGALPTTGHPTQFMNLGGYFMNNSGFGGMQSGGSRVGGVGGSAPPARRR
jgi:hypothetical protein